MRDGQRKNGATVRAALSLWGGGAAVGAIAICDAAAVPWAHLRAGRLTTVLSAMRCRRRRSTAPLALNRPPRYPFATFAAASTIRRADAGLTYACIIDARTLPTTMPSLPVGPPPSLFRHSRMAGPL